MTRVAHPSPGCRFSPLTLAPVPSLSIVMPCLNGAGTILGSLDSIRDQGASQLQVVVADGGSSDGTLDLLKIRRDVEWHSEPDLGLSDAFNRGVAMASGDIIGWLNADDVYLPGALFAVQEAFDAHPTLTWLTGRCLIYGEDGREIRRPVTRYKNALLRKYTYPLHLTHNFVSAPATFFRRDAFLAIGGMDLSLKYSMDYDLYLRFGRDSPPKILDRDLSAFTMAEGTLSMTGFEKQFAEHAAVAGRYRADAPLAVAANGGLSRGIVMAYRTMRLARRARSALS